MNRYRGQSLQRSGERVSITVPLPPRRYRVLVDIARLLARKRSLMGTVESTYGPAFYCRRHADLVEYMSYKRASFVDRASSVDKIA